jgi:hypothetical protein
MNFIMGIAIWLATLFGIPTATGEELFDGGEQQAMSGDAKKSSSSSEAEKRGLTRKGYIYNGF